MDSKFMSGFFRELGCQFWLRNSLRITADNLVTLNEKFGSSKKLRQDCGCRVRDAIEMRLTPFQHHDYCRVLPGKARSFPTSIRLHPRVPAGCVFSSRLQARACPPEVRAHAGPRGAAQARISSAAASSAQLAEQEANLKNELNIINTE